MSQVTKKGYTPLPPNQYKILHILRIFGNDSMFFTGFLPYLRDYTESSKKFGYNDLDKLDRAIADSVKMIYPNIQIRTPRLIFLEGQIDDTLLGIRGVSVKEVKIQINGEIDPYASNFPDNHSTIYFADLKMRVDLLPNDPKLDAINDYFICEVQSLNLEELTKTLYPV